MKKIIFRPSAFCFLLSAFCFLLTPFFLNAQQYQLPESSFEKWTNKNGIYGPYEEFETDFFYTLNSLYAVENGELPADITALKDGNAQHGNFCVKLKSGKITVNEDIFLPGMVGTINEEFVEEFLKSGGNVTMHRDWLGYDTPHTLEGWYKYAPSGGDSALIEIGFHRGGVNPVFLKQQVVKNTVNEWTTFVIEIPKQYWDMEFSGIRVLFVASAGVRFDTLTLCKGQIGSTLWIDNISLNYTYAGQEIKQSLFSPITAKAFPNPAAEMLNIELNEHFTGKVMVYNISGSMVMEENIYGTESQLNTSALASGNYVYKIMKENTIFAQGKLVVTK